MKTHFFDADTKEIMDADGACHPVPSVIAEAVSLTNDVDIVHEWAVNSGLIARGDSVAMLADVEACAA